MFTINGQTIPYDRAWTHPETGNHYPANWLRLASSESKSAAGLVEVSTTTPTYDQRFYSDANTPKALDDEPLLDTEGNDTGDVTPGLKTLYKTEQDAIAATLLAPSDWRVTKALEVSSSFAAAQSALPDAWKTYRAAVRTACNTRQTEIDACSDVDALKQLLFGEYKSVKTKQQQMTDSNGDGVVAGDGSPIMETVNDLDSEGNVQYIINSNVATPWPDLPA
jgi:hypothetical protein